MPPLYFDPEKVEVVELPDDVNQPHQIPNKVLPLARLLISSDFPFDRGDFPRQKVSRWSEEEALRIGTMVTKELSQQTPPRTFTKTVATRLHILGVFPPHSYFQVLRHFGGFGQFKEQIGIDSFLESKNGNRNEAYDKLSLDELSTLLYQRYGSLFESAKTPFQIGPFTRKMITTMNQMNLSPSYDYFLRRFGGMRRFNDHNGYPDIQSWDNHDYITYGATILRHNGARSLGQDNINLLASHKHGPYTQAIKARFDWKEFQKLSEAELNRQLADEEKHRQQVLHYFEPLRRQLPKSAQISFVEMAQHRALSLISARYLNGQSPKLPALINSCQARKTVDVILQKYPRLTLADIETTAVAMDIFDDLWPMQHPQRLPILANCERK